MLVMVMGAFCYPVYKPIHKLYNHNNEAIGMSKFIGKGIMTEVSDFTQQLINLWQVKSVMTVSLASIAAFFGVEPSMLTCLNVLMGLDLLLGIIVAFRTKTYCPLKVEKTVKKVMAYYSSLFMVSLVCGYSYELFDTDLRVADIYLLYLISTESLSVMKHGEELGIKYPAAFGILLNGFSQKVEDTISDLVDTDNDNDEYGEYRPHPHKPKEPRHGQD